LTNEEWLGEKRKKCVRGGGERGKKKKKGSYPYSPRREASLFKGKKEMGKKKNRGIVAQNALSGLCSSRGGKGERFGKKEEKKEKKKKKRAGVAARGLRVRPKRLRVVAFFMKKKKGTAQKKEKKKRKKKGASSQQAEK